MIIRYLPVYSFFRFLWLLLRRKIHFPKERIGEERKSGENRKFRVFRYIIVEENKNRSKRQKTTLIVQFQISSMTPNQNIRFSRIPIPFFAGLPGFRSKLWLVDEQRGYYQGIYEWDTEKDAQKYASSFAMNFMKRRAVPGTVTYEIQRKETK